MSPVGRGKNVFEIVMGVQGDDQTMAAMQQMVQGLRNVRRETQRTTKSGSELGRSFRNIALRTAAYIGIVRSVRAISNALRGAVGAGIEYNETIEQSRLAIATLIAAQADLVDSQGTILSGAEELDEAYALAVGQVQKLRIAGIQTAATTKELVDAFQQAVGAGLATGLTLDEIRTVTIRIAQAAGALGVPYRQLNEEIRSILGGIIDQNTRIAKALGITNEQVRLAKEQNRLADFLLQKFEAFGTAGERIVNTWAALKSNVQEAFELLSGEITFPAFESIRKAGLDALSRVFDFDTAEIAAELKDLVTLLQQFSGSIGDQLAGAIEKVVDGAEALNNWIRENNDEAILLVDAFTDLFSAIGSGLSRTTAAWVKYTARVGLLRQAVETTEDAFRFLARNTGAQVVAILAGIAAGFGLINALLGPAGVIFMSVAVAVGVLATALDTMNTSVAEAVDRLDALEQAQIRVLLAKEDNLITILRMVMEYERLQEAIDDVSVAEEERRKALERQAEIIAFIATEGDKWDQAIKDARDSNRDLSEALKDVIRLEVALNAAVIARNENEIRTATAARDAAQEMFDQLERANIYSNKWAKEIEEHQQRIDNLTASNKDLRDSIARIQQALAGDIIGVQGPLTDTSADDLKTLQAEVAVMDAQLKAWLAERSAQIKIALDEDIFTYEQYYTTLDKLQQTAYNRQIANQQRLLAAETDPKKKAAVEAKIIQLQSQARIASLQNDYRFREQQEQQTQKLLQVQQRYLSAIGETSEAVRLKLSMEWKDLLADLERQGNEAGINLIEGLIQVESARARFKELERIVSAAQQGLQDQINRIDLEVETGGIHPEEGRRKTVAAYRDLRSEIGLLLPELQSLSQEIQNPEDQAAVNRLIALYEELGLTIASLEDEWKEFRTAVESAAVDTLARHMSDAIAESESLGDALNKLILSGDALRSMLASLAQAIVEVTARMIAQKAVESASFALFGAAGGGLVPAFAGGGRVRGYAPGGPIRGPGGPTDDKILARLSAGEYVVRAAAVRKYGVDFMRAINRGLLPAQVTDIRRFARGGMVTESGASSVGRDFHGELTVGLSPGLVMDQMDSSDGERLVMKIISKNRRGIRSSLGL